MSNDNAITVKGLHKSFKLPHEQSSGLKQSIVNFLKRKKGYEVQHVLNDISFEVKKGDFFGIVGRNGSGKSTLLKLLAGIYTPDKGKISINGTTVPFIELGVGFNPELTGRENIFLNGALLGFSHKEMENMYDDIVEFAELEKFMDQKLKNYSSGMQVRLAFSIAIKAQGDILILDEVLAVGDEAFQRKCDNFFGKIKKDKNKTVILVTHSMSDVKKYCNKAILIENGELELTGDPNDVANGYTKENFNSVVKQDDEQLSKNDDFVNYKIDINTDKILTSNDRLVFDIIYENRSDKIIHDVVIEIDNVSRSNTPILLDRITELNQKRGKYIVRYEYNLEPINDGEYIILSTLRNKNNEIMAYTKANSSSKFLIINKDKSSKWPILRTCGQVVYVKEN